MGWDGVFAQHDKNEQKDYIANDMASNLEVLRHEVIEESFNEFTHYVAVKHTEKGEVFGLVVLAHHNPHDGKLMTHYKWMDETVGPFAYGASKKLISLLTPTDSENANEWRETCAGVRHPITGGQA